MASEESPVAGEAPEQQDQSIKARKFQLFEQQQKETGVVAKKFSAYVRDTPPAVLSPGVKTTLGAVAVLVVMLLLAAFLVPPPRRRHAALVPASPRVVAFCFDCGSARGRW
jgi:hypothetical protein